MDAVSVFPPALLPPDVGPWFALVLLAASFATSFMTAALGLGGGLALLAVMATGLPTATVIPVHGVVQFGSNAGRALIQRAHVDWTAAAWFCGGGLLGALLGGNLVVNLPDAPLKIAIGAFILLMTWGPKPSGIGASNPALAAQGAIGGALTMVFGATGPFTAAALATRAYDRLTQVATFSVCMTIQHVVKVLTFGALGFTFAPWAVLMAAMIAVGFAGTVVGTRYLHHLPEARFARVLRWLITAMAAMVAVQGLRGLLG